MLVSRVTWILAAGVLFVMIADRFVSADIYRYKDENGVWHFSNIKSNKRYQLYMRQAPKKRPENGLNKYNDIILLASNQFQVESSMIKAIIKAESDFDHRAVSKRGAQGLMQLMPDTADEMNVKDPFDPKENILGGTRYFSLLLKRFQNDKTLALAAYNAGPEEVESRNGIPPFPETQTYVKRVMGYYRKYNGGTK